VLGAALDLIIGPANATSNIAAACGGAVWLVCSPSAWPRLGAEHYPWYPQMRVFTPERVGDWTPMMHEVARALALRAAQG
jgi:hypothetical protein